MRTPGPGRGHALADAPRPAPGAVDADGRLDRLRWTRRAARRLPAQLRRCAAHEFVAALRDARRTRSISTRSCACSRRCIAEPPALRPQRAARRRTPMRLAQEPSVTHAPASLAGYEPGADGRRDRLLVHFFGLFGPDGPLPLHLTEYARDRQRNHDDPTLRPLPRPVPSPRCCRCSTAPGPTCAPTVSFDRPDRTGSAYYIGALIGLSTLGPARPRRDAGPDEAAFRRAAGRPDAARRRPGRDPVGVLQHAGPGRQLRRRAGSILPPPTASRLPGRPAATAGARRRRCSAARVWSRQHKFRIVLRPAHPGRIRAPAARRPQLPSARPDRAQLCRRRAAPGT